jgi:putative aldouronate transport system substrate-binding protein
MKKAISVILTVILLSIPLLSLTGCGTQQGSGNPATAATASAAPSPGSQAATAQGTKEAFTSSYPITDKPITLKILSTKASVQGPWEEMSFFKYMEELTNIHMEFVLATADSYKEKKNLAFASGELPDVFFGGSGLTPTEEVKYGSEGLLIPLNNLIDTYAVNIQKLFSTTGGLREAITTDDGNIYSLFYYSGTPRGSQTCFWYNGRWLDALGVKKADLPTTIEGLVELLKRFYNEDPNGNKVQDEIPLSITLDGSKTIDALRSLILNSYGVIFNKDGFYAGDDGKVTFQFTSDKFRSYLQLANELYASKLLDQNLFTQTTEQLIATSMDNKVGLVNASMPTGNYTIKTQTDEIKQFPMLNTLTSAQNTKPVKNMNNAVTRGLFAITKECKYPEAAIRWVDYLYSYDGSMMAWQGAEGKGYEYVDNTRKTWKQLLPEGMTTVEFRGSQTPACGTAVPFYIYSGMLEGLTNTDELYSNAEARAQMQYLKMAYPLAYFSESENADLLVSSTDVTTYLKEMEAKFITGRLKIDDSNWKTYVSTIESIGAIKMQKIYQDAYNRYLNKKK